MCINNNIREGCQLSSLPDLRILKSASQLTSSMNVSMDPNPTYYRRRGLVDNCFSRSANKGSGFTGVEAKSRNHRAGHCMNRGELLVNKCDLLGEKGPLMVVHVIDFYHGDAKLACYKIV